MIVDELLVSLGFDADTKEVKDFKKANEDLTNTLKKVGTAAAAAGAAVLGMVKMSTNAADALAKQARAIGMTVEEYDALRYATELTVGSYDDLEMRLKEFKKKVGDYVNFDAGEGKEVFQKLGISSQFLKGNMDNLMPVLLEVADGVKDLDSTSRFDLLDKLGLDDISLLFEDGASGISVLVEEAKALGVTTEEYTKKAEAFNDSLSRLWRVITYFGRALAEAIVPAIDSVVTSITDWVKENKELIQTRIDFFIEHFNSLLKAATLAIGVLIGSRLLPWLLAITKAFKAAGIWATIMNAAVMLIPAAIAAIVAAISLLIDDVATMDAGGNSLFGSLMAKYPEFKGALELVAAVFRGLPILIKLVGKAIASIFNGLVTGVKIYITAMVDSIKFWRDVVMVAVGFTKEVWASFWGWLSDIASKTVNFLVNVLKSWLGEERFNEWKKGFESFFDIVKALWQAVVDYFVKKWEEGFGRITKGIEWVKKFAGKGVEIAANAAGSVNEGWQDTKARYSPEVTEEGKAAFAGLLASASNPNISNSSVNSKTNQQNTKQVTINQKNTFNVSEAKEGRSTATQVAKKNQEALRKAEKSAGTVFTGRG